MNFSVVMTLKYPEGTLPDQITLYPFENEHEMIEFKKYVDAIFKDDVSILCENCERIDVDDYEPERDESRD